MRTFLKFFMMFTVLVLIYQTRQPAQKIYAAEEGQYSIAYINDFNGDCQIKRNGENKYEDIDDLYLPLYENDTVRTGKDGYAEIAFDDDTIVKLDPNSDMVILTLERRDWKQTIIELLTGKLFTSVNKLQGDDKFVVKTKMAMAAVKGTDFAVDAGDQNNTDSKVGVYGGSVKVSGLDANGKVINEVTIPENQETTVNQKDRKATNPYAMKDYFLKRKTEMFDMRNRVKYMRELKRTGRLRQYQLQVRQKKMEYIRQRLNSSPNSFSRERRIKMQRMLYKYDNNNRSFSNKKIRIKKKLFDKRPER
jgi:hypothetical protein